MDAFAFAMPKVFESWREKTWKEIPTYWLSPSDNQSFLVYYCKKFYPSESLHDKI